MIVKIISLLFFIVGIGFVLDLTPLRISDDLIALTSKKISLRDRAKELRTGKRKKTIGERLKYIQTSLEAMGKGDKFALVICASVFLFAAGAFLAIILDNLYLIPAFAIGFAVIPFVYVMNSLDKYDRHIKEDLETTLSTITSTYERTNDIVASVKENLISIKPPLREHFEAFITDATQIYTPKKAIINLRKKVDDDIFHEWCTALIQCQDDSTMKETLMPIVTKLGDIRIVNTEMAAMMNSVRVEYYTMVGMVIGNVPLLYILNKDWFHTLVFETCGKVTLGVCGLVILITYMFMLKFTKPIEYKG